jgi:hypothetical protein
LSIFGCGQRRLSRTHDIPRRPLSRAFGHFDAKLDRFGGRPKVSSVYPHQIFKLLTHDFIVLAQFNIAMTESSNRLPSINSHRRTFSTSLGFNSKRKIFENKLDRLRVLITQSENPSPDPYEGSRQIYLSPTSRSPASLMSIGTTPVSRQGKLMPSASKCSSDFVSEMLVAYKQIILAKHSPEKVKASLANAQKFIRLRRQEVPLKEAVKLSTKKIDDIDMLLKQVTLLKFSEQHYDYEHITKQYVSFEDSHNIVNGLIIHEGNEAYANEVIDPRIAQLKKAKYQAEAAKRKQVKDEEMLGLRNKGSRRGSLLGEETKASSYAQKWRMHPKQEKARKVSQGITEASYGSLLSRKGSNQRIE